MNLQTVPPALDARPTYIRYQVLAWACALSMITYIDRVCFKSVEKELSFALGLTPQQFAWAFSAFGLAYALFEVPSGWLGDRFGPRLVLCRIVMVWSLFTAMTGLIWKFAYPIGPVVFNSLMLLILIRFLFGAGEAGAYPNIARALRNWFPYSRRGLAQGLLWMFGRWGGAVAPLLIGLFSWMFGWRGAFIAFGILGAIWVGFFAIFFRDRPEEHSGVSKAELDWIRDGGRDGHNPPALSWGTMLRSPTLWCLSLMYFCSNAGWCFFITWDVRYYETVLGLSGDTLRTVSGAPLFFGGVACILGGFLTDRQVRLWGRRWGRTLQGMISYALGGTFFLLALATRDPWLAVPALCLASFMKDFAMAVSWSTCIDIGHRYSGTVAGFMNMVGNLGTFVSPPIVAYLATLPKTNDLTVQAASTVGAALGPMGQTTMFVRGTNWELALVYSATMFFLAALGWLFINPRKVIVYNMADRRRMREQGLDV